MHTKLLWNGAVEDDLNDFVDKAISMYYDEVAEPKKMVSKLQSAT
jgi:hypothetical protein